MNRNILKDALIGKFATEMLYAIADEAFIYALPFTKKDMTKSVVSGLSEYSRAVMGSLGGLNMLGHALESKTAKGNQKEFLNSIAKVCMESAVEAADAVVDDMNLDNEDRSVAEIADASEIPEEVYDKFVDKCDDLDLGHISDIIKKKTIDVIKAEKNAIKEDEAFEEELKDAVVDEELPEEEKEEALESFIGMAVKKNLPRKRITFFSKLQDIAIESLVYSNEEGKIPFNTLTKMTVNHFGVNKYDSKLHEAPLMALESQVEYGLNNDLQDKDLADVADKSMIFAIITYTLFETLRTMNIHDISKEDVMKFIDSPSDVKEKILNNQEYLNTELAHSLSKFKEMIEKSNDIEMIERVVEMINDAQDNINKLASGEVKSLTADILVAAEERIKEINIENARPKKVLSEFELREKDETIAQFNKVCRMYGANPNVDEIRLVMDKRNPDTDNIDVTCVGRDGGKVASTFIPVKYRPAFGSIMDYVKESFSNSNMASIDKKVCIYYTDGQGRENLK